MFFVISGFLITSILLEDLEQSDFSLARFYARRVRRIFPPLALVLTGRLIAGYFLLLPSELATLAKHATGGALFASKFVLWQESSYFDASAGDRVLLHLWSLGIEEQFYIVWPLVLTTIVRFRAMALTGTAILLLVSFRANVIVTGSDPTAAFYLPVTRAWKLLAGALLAIRRSRLPAWISWFGRAAS